MAPKTKPAGPAAAMKQGRLSFASSKRNASASLVGKANVKSASTATAVAKIPSPANDRESTRSASIQSRSSASDEDQDVLMISTSAEPKAKRQRISAAPSKVMVPSSKRERPEDASDSESDPEFPPDDLDVLEKSGHLLRQFGLARHKMGSVQPVHSEGRSKAYQILRVFDTSYEYGPCVGVTRLERWERAQMLGLNPPNEIREILMTKQGIEDNEYKQNVFYGEVA